MSQRYPDNSLPTAATADDAPHWRVALSAIAAGFLGALALGKVPAALDQLSATLTANLTALGWIASMLAFVGASGGIALGLIAQRVNPRHMIIWALLALTIGSIAGALAPGASGVILSRAIEGIGLVSIAVAAPRLVTAHAGRDRIFAMGLWSCYVPVGMSVGIILTTVLLTVMDWRTSWLVHGAVTAVFLMLFVALTRDARSPKHDNEAHENNSGPAAGNWRAPLLHPGAWLLGLVFACYAFNWMALMTWLPDFSSSNLALDTFGAAALTAFIVATNALGNLAGAWLIRRGLPRHRMIVFGLLCMALCGPAVMWLEPGGAGALVLLAVFSGGAGGVPPAIFGDTVTLARNPCDVAAINGVIVQCSQAGQLAGAPVLGWLMARTGGYSVTGWAFLVAAGVGLVAVRAVMQLARGQRQRQSDN